MLYVNMYTRPLHVWTSERVEFDPGAKATDDALCGITAPEANSEPTNDDATNLLEAPEAGVESIDDLLNDGQVCENCHDSLLDWMYADPSEVRP